MPERAEPSPMRVIAALNLARSSAFSIAFFEAPINSTSNFDSTPSRARSRAQLSAVWPPIVGNNASGRSRSMILASICQVIGSMYVTSAISGSVMIVAGLELTRMTR